MKSLRPEEFSDIEIDSHALCHFFEHYHSGRHDDQEFSFLDYPQSLEIAEDLLERHVKEQLRRNELWCNNRVIMPILKYNMENLIDFNKFSFKPDCLKNEEYLELVKSNINDGHSKSSFGFTEGQMYDFLSSDNPKDFFARQIKKGIELPVKGSKKVLDIINTIKGEIDENELDSYIAKVYSPNDRIISTDELIGNLENFEQAGEIEKGVFVDVDGTLIVKGQLSKELVESLEKTDRKVVIFSGGVPDLQTENLRELGFPEKFLPVLSKDLYKGKRLETLIDDSMPDYQGFGAMLHFFPRKYGEDLILISEPEGFQIDIGGSPEEVVLNSSLEEIESILKKFKGKTAGEMSSLQGEKKANIFERRIIQNREDIEKLIKLNE